MEKIRVIVKKFPGNEDVPLPRYMSPNAAGMDICAAVKEDTTLKPGEIKLIPTGITIALPPGFEAQIRPRSGLAIKHGISIPNTPGTIDADYRGEVKVILINHSNEDFVIENSDRIAQGVIATVTANAIVDLKRVDSIDENTERGAGGFGSTGTK